MDPCPPIDETCYCAFAYEAEDEICESDKVFLFTFNPDPNRYASTFPSIQYESLLLFFFSKVDKIFSKFAFTPELTLNGNVHIHGWYVVKDNIKLHKQWLPHLKLFGFIKIDVMHNKNALEYYKKDIEEMNSIIDNMPIPLTHINHQDYRDIWKQERNRKTIKLHPHRKNNKTSRDVTKYFK